MSIKNDLLHRLRSNGWEVEPRQDLYLITRGDKRLWLNLREKSSASYCHRLRRSEFGMRLSDWQRYKKLAGEGEEVYSIVFSGGKTYYALVAALAPGARVYDGDKLDKGGTVFVPVDAYQQRL